MYRSEIVGSFLLTSLLMFEGFLCSVQESQRKRKNSVEDLRGVENGNGS